MSTHSNRIAVSENTNKHASIEVYSFFAGLGLLDLGFEDAGFKIIFVNEHNKRFLDAYKAARNFKQNKSSESVYSSDDVRMFLSNKKWYSCFPSYNERDNRIIGFIGGPPCPDFSVAGKNAGENGVNGQLTTIYFNLIRKRLPDFFVLENVKGLYQTRKHHEYYERMKALLKDNGYALLDSIENALCYGVPQYRERLILIGIRKKTFGEDIDFSIGNHRCFEINKVLNCNWPMTNDFSEGIKRKKPKNIIKELTVQYWFDKNKVKTHANANDVFSIKNRSRYYSVAEGDCHGKSFKRLHRWRFSPTAAYGNNEVHLHPYLPRRISVAEALSIQSVPKEFCLPMDIPLTAKFKMVGNGVPYLLALGIAKDLYEWITKKIRSTEENE